MTIIPLSIIQANWFYRPLTDKDGKNNNFPSTDYRTLLCVIVLASAFTGV